MLKRNRIVGIGCFVLFVMGMATLANGQIKQPDESIRVMSFNLRLGVAKDGDNHWDKRKTVVAGAIENARADIVGTQETFDFQAAYLAKQLPEFDYVGRSRVKDANDEQCGIFFRSSRFDKLIEGHFWLSETPDRPGSKSWDSSLPRMATWLKLWDRLNERAVFVVNTHFDHRGQQARKESAKQIRRFVASLPEGSAVVVTGDFNAAVDSAPYRALFGDTIASTETVEDAKKRNAQNGVGTKLLDTFRLIHPKALTDEGTFNGFVGKTDGARIDWIAATENFEVMAAEIDRYSVDGRYPSDHFPVTATLKFKPSP